MASRISKTVLNSLTTAALALPGVAYAHGEAKAPVSSSSGVASGSSQSWYDGIKADMRYTYYEEAGPRYNVNVWQAHFVVPADKFQYTLDFQADGQSGATQHYVTVGAITDANLPPNQVVGYRTGSTINDNRSEVTFKTEYFATDARYELDLYYSSEHDVWAPAVSAVGQWNFNKNNTILIAGAGVTYEKSKPTQDGVWRQIPQPRKGEHSYISKYYVGLRQDLTKYAYIYVSNEYQYQQGNLNDPYSAADVFGNSTAYEQYPGDAFYFPNFFTGPTLPDGATGMSDKRPHHRSIWMPMIRFVQYVPWTDGSAHFQYRFGADDWDMQSHTFEILYFQPFWGKWMLTPLVRYYSQSEADFYGPLYNIGPNAVAAPSRPFTPKGWTSDYRLSAYGTVNAELTLSYQAFDMFKVGATAGIYKLKPGWTMSHESPIINPALPKKGYAARYFAFNLNFKL